MTNYDDNKSLEELKEEQEEIVEEKVDEVPVEQTIINNTSNMKEKRVVNKKKTVNLMLMSIGTTQEYLYYQN